VKLQRRPSQPEDLATIDWLRAHPSDKRTQKMLALAKFQNQGLDGSQSLHSIAPDQFWLAAWPHAPVSRAMHLQGPFQKLATHPQQLQTEPLLVGLRELRQEAIHHRLHIRHLECLLAK